MVTKRIVCLANSRKLSGRCVAGREFQDGRAGAWIRPVSARPNEEVSEYERQYEDGSDPRVLDVIDVPLLEHRPKHYQQENWLLDPDYYWKRVDHLAWLALVRLVERPDSLWINGHSTYHGSNDQIPITVAEGVESSLVLIRVDSLHLQVFNPGAAFGNPKRRVQARFAYSGQNYHLYVTDPVIERSYLAQGDGVYNIGESCLAISLGEPFKDNCYKLVAAIISRQTE